MLTLLLLACDPAATPADRSAGTAPLDLTAGDSAPPGDSADSGEGDPVDSGPADSGAPGEGSPEREDCDPELTVERAHLLEGEIARIGARCRGAGWTVAPLELPRGALWDGRELTWLTGPADAGLVTVTFTLSPEDPDTFPQTASVELSIADGYADPDNVPPDPATYTSEWGLPVIHVITSGGIRSEYGPATVYFDGTRYEAEVKIRGASSASYTKKSYTLNFGAENIDLGEWLPDKKDHLVLITPMDDNSYVRQKLAYDLWRDIADYWGEERLAPRSFFAVLYLNGSYHGLYTALDRVDEELVGELGFVRSGNLYKAVSHDANFYLKPNLHAGYEKKEGEDLSDFTDLDALVRFTGSSSTEDFLAGADQWIQLEEFMDWNLFVHFTAADDSGGKNSYLYNDPEDWMFRYAPWDFNHSFGQSWQTLRIGPDTYNDFRSTNKVFDHIQSDPETAAALWGRLRELMDDGPMATAALRERLDAYYALIDDSAARDWEAWRGAYRDYWGGVRGGSCSDCLEYEGEKQYVYDWLADREAWMRTYHPG